MQDLISNLPAVVFEYAFYPDGKNRFHFVGGSVRAILGIDPDALMGDASLLRSVVVGRDPAIFDIPTRDAASERHRDITVVVGGSGVHRNVRFSYRDEYAEDGVILRRGVAVEMPPTPSHIYEEIFEELPIGVVIHREGVVLFANKYAHMVVGAKASRSIIGMNAMDFVHPNYYSGIHDRISQVAAGQPVPMVEEKFVCLDGRVIDVETLAFPFLYNGNLSIQVIFRDITEKKRSEALVRRNEILFRQLFQNVPMAVVMLDEGGKVTEANRGFEQMFGFRSDDIKGKNLNDFIVPDDRRSEGIDLNNLITSNRVVSMESIRRHRSGRMINVILCGVPVIFENEPIGIYGVYVDISDRKIVEEELKVRNAELDNFVYKVSHDLRAPLSSVLGLVNLSKLQGNTDNPMEYLELIGEKIQALDNFIGDVLSHSKNLKMEVNIGVVDLRKIIEQTFTDLGYLKGASETRRSVKIEGMEFYSDHWRVSEIFRNLISNAIKYRRPGSDDSEIDIRIRVDHLHADITFADNGIGITEANLKRVFEMFYRATEQAEGSGIGLYIVKNAVEKLGGQIGVASKPDFGTKFHIVLPNRASSSMSTSKSREKE